MSDRSALLRIDELLRDVVAAPFDATTEQVVEIALASLRELQATAAPSGPWVLREDLEPALFGECHPCYFQEQEDWRDAVVATLDALTHGRSDDHG